MVRLPGTETTVPLLERARVELVDAALFKRAVQALDAPLLRAVGEQAKLISCTGPTRLRVTVLLMLPDAAVITAAWSAVTCTAVAVKLAEVCPAARVTLAGTVRLPLLLESATRYPPASAAEVRETVHDILTGVATVVVVQFIPLHAGCRDRETVPGEAAVGIELPAAVVATTPLIWMGIVSVEGLGAT
jgi:hypothetical protein